MSAADVITFRPDDGDRGQTSERPRFFDLLHRTWADAADAASRLRRMRTAAATSRSVSHERAAAQGHADRLSDLATLVIVVTAGVASWAGWVYLGRAVGWGVLTVPNPFGAGLRLQLAWLLPVFVDVFAFLAGRAWLNNNLHEKTRKLGRNLAIAALILSMTGNAFGHAAEAHVWRPNWMALVVVSVIPAVVLFLAGYLRTVRTREIRQIEEREAARERKRSETETTKGAAPATSPDSAPRKGSVAAVAAGGDRPTPRGSSTNRPRVNAASEEKRAAVREYFRKSLEDGREASTKEMSDEFGIAIRTIRRYLPDDDRTAMRAEVVAGRG